LASCGDGSSQQAIPKVKAKEEHRQARAAAYFCGPTERAINCVPPPPAPGPVRRFTGTMHLGLEEISFTRGSDPSGEKIWLEIKNDKLRACLIGRWAMHGRPLSYHVVLEGREAGDGDAPYAYGHMGVYDKEILVRSIVSGSPCSQ